MSGRTLQASIPPFGLRMQADLHARLKASAAANNRSLNSEIVDRLERSVAGVDQSEAKDMSPVDRLALAQHRLRQAMEALSDLELERMLE